MTIEAGSRVQITGAYGAKRFAGPIYYRMMAKVSRQMAAKD